MPEISRFLGIVIRMYYRDHPPAHFHAEYGDREITVDIETETVRGHFPRKALAAVLEWSKLHRDELVANWDLVCRRLPLKRIPPLE